MNKLKNPIVIGFSTLLFYKSDGWTLRKIRELLISPNLKITWRDELNYWACYEKSGWKVFKKSKVMQHQLINPLGINEGDINWYLEENK